MKTVRDDDGKRYLLLKRSSSASLVRDPATGNSCYVRNDRLEDAGDTSPLETAAAGVSGPVRRLLRGVHDDRTLGLLVELADADGLGVRTILDRYDFCESDLHGRFGELTAVGLITEVEIDGERGYRVTDDCERALETVRIEGGG